jgi:hypothetical protein
MSAMEHEDTQDFLHEPARVRVELGSRVLIGNVRIPDVPFGSRVSDVVNDTERRFLPLADVEALDGRTGQVIGRSAFVLVRLDAVDLILPLHEPEQRQSLD